MSTVESNTTKIKHALFKVLNLPVKAVEGTEAWIEKEGHAFIIRVKTDVGNFRKEWKNNVNYSHDAVNSAENARIVTFKVPVQFHPEIQQLQNIQDSPDGVMNKTETVNQIVTSINNKI